MAAAKRPSIAERNCCMVDCIVSETTPCRIRMPVAVSAAAALEVPDPCPAGCVVEVELPLLPWSFMVDKYAQQF